VPICKRLNDIHEDNKEIKMPLIKLYLKNTEKDFRDLFVDFRDKKITLYQVRARMLEKSRGLIYKTVDDMKT
jgi:hypothetical protein